MLIIVMVPCRTESEAFELERRLIAEARAARHPLCNFTDGGEGTSGHFKSPEVLEKLRIATIRQWDLRGRKPPKPLRAGICPCVHCGMPIRWVSRPRKVCSKRCESALYRKPYIPTVRPLGASGIRGVYSSHDGRWKAGISRKDGYQHLGTFLTKEEAISARRAAINAD